MPLSALVSRPASADGTRRSIPATSGAMKFKAGTRRPDSTKTAPSATRPRSSPSRWTASPRRSSAPAAKTAVSTSCTGPGGKSREAHAHLYRAADGAAGAPARPAAARLAQPHRWSANQLRDETRTAVRFSRTASMRSVSPRRPPAFRRGRSPHRRPRDRNLRVDLAVRTVASPASEDSRHRPARRKSRWAIRPLATSSAADIAVGNGVAYFTPQAGSGKLVALDPETGQLLPARSKSGRCSARGRRYSAAASMLAAAIPCSPPRPPRASSPRSTPASSIASACRARTKLAALERKSGWVQPTDPERWPTVGYTPPYNCSLLP